MSKEDKRVKRGAKKHDERMERGVKVLKKMGRHGLLESQKEDYPPLYELTTANLFGDVWTRPHLDLRDRQLITLAAGVALARTSGNHSHYHSALQMGISREELIELIVHVGHYAGWPVIGLAMKQLKKVIAAGGSGKNRKNSPAQMRKLSQAWEH